MSRKYPDLQTCTRPASVFRVRVGPSLSVPRRHVSAVEFAHHGVGELAVDFDVFFAADRVPRSAVGRARVSQEGDEIIGQEIAKNLLFVEAVNAAAGDQAGPVIEPRADGLDVRGKLKTG